MSLREKHRQMMNQSSNNNKERFEKTEPLSSRYSQKKEPPLSARRKQNNEQDVAQSKVSETNENDISKSPQMESKGSSPKGPDPSPINASIGLARPATAHVFPPTEADIARKKYLEEAKERNNKSRKQFEDRVKGYFEKGLAIEQAKMQDGTKVKKSNKDANHEKVESGLFLQQLKSIGLDVGKMAATTKAMKPERDDNEVSGRFRSSDTPSLSSSYSTPPSYSIPESNNYSHTSSSSSFELETRIARIEMTVNSIQRSANEHDKKLDKSIALQEQILRLLQAQTNTSELEPLESLQPQKQEYPSIQPQGGRRRRF